MNDKKNFSRRQFLIKTTSMAAGAFAFPYIVPSSALGKGAIAPSNRIVMGAVGLGNQGSGDMRGFLGKREVQMVGLCDVDNRLNDKYKKFVDDKYNNNDCKTYQDFRDLIGRGDLDALTMALPEHWHGIIAVTALKAGLDVHGQKPLARTISEGRAICDAVERYHRIWQTGSQQRSSSKFRRACELVRNGRIGKVSKVKVGMPTGRGKRQCELLPVPKELDWNMWLGPAKWRPYTNFGRGNCHFEWRWIMDYAGGSITDWAGHHIDIAHWGLGFDRTGPVEIEGRGNYHQDGLFDTAPTYKFNCKYANGVEMIVEDSNNYDDPKHVDDKMGPKWYGEKGWIHVNRHVLLAEPSSILKEVIGPNETRLYKSNNHTQNFLDCVKSRRETIVPAEVGHRSISVGLLGEIAMLTGRKLKWDPQKERFLNDDEANRMLWRPMRSPWHL